jgi:hypothetical protein
VEMSKGKVKGGADETKKWGWEKRERQWWEVVKEWKREMERIIAIEGEWKHKVEIRWYEIKNNQDFFSLYLDNSGRN